VRGRSAGEAEGAAPFLTALRGLAAEAVEFESDLSSQLERYEPDQLDADLDGDQVAKEGQDGAGWGETRAQIRGLLDRLQSLSAR
jgi:hypothetical protein